MRKRETIPYRAMRAAVYASFLWTVSSLLASCGREAPTETAPHGGGIIKRYSIGPLSVEERFSARRVSVADFLDIDLTASGPASATLLEPDFDGPLEDFAVYARTSSPPELGGDGRAVERFHIVLAPNGVGKRIVPSIRFEVRGNDGSKTVLISKPVEITVDSVIDSGGGKRGAEPKPADIASDFQGDEPPSGYSYGRRGAWAAVATAIVLALGTFLAATRGNRGKGGRRK
jgi:hypothetical protein